MNERAFGEKHVFFFFFFLLSDPTHYPVDAGNVKK